MKSLFFICLLLISFSYSSVAQKKYPVVEMRQGRVFLETGNLHLDSVAIYFSDGKLIAQKKFDQSANPELPSVFTSPGEYTLIFSVKKRKKIVRKLLVL
ncbi:MAG: hypothetical protein K2X48_13890 [Chitinophagaceae bacterium]|nr:hypothetical protein [Chitinophagaceae bacterium]